MMKNTLILLLLGMINAQSCLLGTVVALISAQVGEETQDHRGINQMDVEKMTVDADSKAPQTEEEKKLMEEWEQHMSDFVPEDISTIVVEPRKEVVN